MQLNNDDDYLAAELRRINWLQSITRIRRLALRVTNASVLLAVIGGFVDPVAGSLGWSLASSALIIWILTLLGTRIFFTRSKASHGSHADNTELISVHPCESVVKLL